MSATAGRCGSAQSLYSHHNSALRINACSTLWWKGRKQHPNHTGILKLLFEWDKITTFFFLLPTESHRVDLDIHNVQPSLCTGEWYQKSHGNTPSCKFSYRGEKKIRKIKQFMTLMLWSLRNQSCTYFSAFQTLLPCLISSHVLMPGNSYEFPTIKSLNLVFPMKVFGTFVFP